MNRLFLTIALLAIMSTRVLAADVDLCVTVPDAWVSATIAAVQDKWPIPDNWYPEEAQGVRVKRWTESKIRSWLRNIVAPYKNEQDREAVLTSGGYSPIVDDDIPIEITGE
jgi:hypothetical protein